MMMMWGDPIGAAALNQPVENSPTTNGPNSASSATINVGGGGNPNPNQQKCISSIYQITSPAHIPTNDIRWQELFLSYDILVHLDRGQIGSTTTNTITMIDQVCSSMAKHARNSSNLAAFAWHLTKMINELMSSCKECAETISTTNNNNNITTTKTTISPTSQSTSTSIQSNKNATAAVAAAGSTGTAFAAKIAMVGKARVICGTLNMFRIICHEVITASFSEDEVHSSTGADSNRHANTTASATSSTHEATTASASASTSSYEFLQEAFTYKSRNESIDVDTSSQLVSALLSFVSMMGVKNNTSSNSNGDKSTNNENDQTNIFSATEELVKTIPEIYDATVLTLMLLNVLFSTQLYQPLLSSMELQDEVYNHIHNNNNNSKNSNGGNENNNNTADIMRRNFFLDIVMHQAYEKRQLTTLGNNINTRLSSTSLSSQQKGHQQQQAQQNNNWTSQTLLSSCMNWMIERPTPPERSIALHMRDMVETIARDIKGEKVGVDGMFENHAIVMARAPILEDEKGGSDNGGGSGKGGGMNGVNSRGGNRRGGMRRLRSAPDVILDATKGMIHLSSSLLLLPFRLMTLALRALGHPEHYILRGIKGSAGEGGYDKLAQLQAAYGARGGSSASIASPTNDVLWLSDSPVADLGSSIFLILSNNYRALPRNNMDNVDMEDCFINNPFRSELASLDDNRWDGWDNTSYSMNGNGYLEDASSAFESVDLRSNNGITNGGNANPKQKRLLTTNFEHLFQSFGGTLHNELGALTLYTLLQSSPIFAASLAVRSDLDMLVLPLLRTLYFSSSVNQHISGRTTITSTKTAPSGEKIANSSLTVSVAQNPFRSQSQLYVIMILLLIFSQDTSFGPDSFRRSTIPVVVWYKERSLKNVSLGSMIVLSLLRCITFNLNRMKDSFLLSNCCAVLLNLSPHIVNLHSYASMRLANCLVSSMKRYTVLVMKNGGRPAEEGDSSSLLGMYADTCRILLQVVKQCIRRKVVDKNLHLLYSLVYLEREYFTVLRAKKSPFRPSDTEKITAMIKKVDTIISKASTRTAEKTMEVLEKSTHILKGTKPPSSSKSNRMISSSASATDDSTISTTSSSTVSGMEDFRFTYEEEADPEIFFVPYLWEIVVGCVTSSTLEWDKKRIKVFALMETMDEGITDLNAEHDNGVSNQLPYSENGDDLV